MHTACGMQVRELSDSIAAQQDADAKAAVKAREEALGLPAAGSVVARQRSTRASKPVAGRRAAKRPAISPDDDHQDAAAQSDGSPSRSSTSYDPLGVCTRRAHMSAVARTCAHWAAVAAPGNGFAEWAGLRLQRMMTRSSQRRMWTAAAVTPGW